MKKFVILLSIFVFVSINVAAVAAETEGKITQPVKQPGMGMPGAPGMPGVPGMALAPGAKQSKDKTTEPNVASEPNEVQIPKEIFDELEKQLLELDFAIAKPSNTMIQKAVDSRVELAKAVQKQLANEMDFIRRQATQEGAKKTVAAIDKLVAARQEQFEKLFTSLEDEKQTLGKKLDKAERDPNKPAIRRDRTRSSEDRTTKTAEDRRRERLEKRKQKEQGGTQGQGQGDSTMMPVAPGMGL